MPLPPQLDIYKASAGSGKTFLLTIKYLQLVFEQPGNYRHVLAVTFTNNATAEMKHRILSELENLARGERTVYGEKLLEAMPHKSFDEIQQQATSIYSAILHDYSRFAVTTIDSFVQKIVRSFAFEIGLDAGFQLKLNTAIVKEDLAGRLFKLLDTDAALRHWVAELAIKRLADGKSWNFRNDMLELANELFKEPFQEFEAGLKTLPDVDAAFKELRQKVFSIVADFEKSWKAAGAQALLLLDENELNELDFHYKKAGFINYFFKASDGIVERPGTRVEEILSNPGMMGGKKPHPRIAPIQDKLHHLLQQLCNQCDSEFELYQTALALSRNIGNLRLMQVFSEQLSHYRSENNVLLISDTHLLLRQLTRDTEASFIYEKTGTRFRHFLIDEFQDTSGFQWDNFKPLLENSLAEGKYNLLVGDVKQAIYRWRSGNWQLLQSKVKEHLNHLQVEMHSLQDNRRSAKPLISFNNFLFFAAPQLLQEELNRLVALAPDEIRARLARDGYNDILELAYAESRQLIPERAPPNGLVDVRFLTAGEQEYEEIMLPQLHLQIEQLLQEGFMAKDIAVLTRNNSEAAAVIEYLVNAQQEPGAARFDLLSADALLLSKNGAVSLLIKAMEVLAGDGGKLALANLRQLVAVHQQKTVSDHDIFISKEEHESILPRAFYRNKAALHRLPLPELVSSLIRVFELNLHAEDAAYLLAFQDLVGDWSRFGSDGLQSFLQYWSDEGNATSLPGGANTNAIEVLTIHKSKGLAFTILLLPYLNWEIKPDAKKNLQLWVNTSGTPFDEVPVVPVRYGSSLQQTAFAYSYFEELLLGMMDNLNLLYVAMTRARRRIFGWAPKPPKTDGFNTIDKLLYAAATTRIIVLDGQQIPGNEGAPHEKEVVLVQEHFDTSEDRWVFGVDEAIPIPSLPGMPELLPPLEQSDWKQRLTVRYKPLVTEQEDSVKLPRELGILLHEAIAQMQHPGALLNVLLQMRQRGLITNSQQKHVQDTLQEIISLPLLEGWKTGEMQRLSERDILTKNKELRRPDLVLYKKDQTLVIDFKFTDDRTADPKYQAQVNEYVSLLQQTSFTNVSGYLIYAGEHVSVVEVLQAQLQS